jgi:hypothetical protein
MKSFKEYMKEYITEVFDSLKPIPIKFGSNEEPFDSDNSYNDKKFAPFHGNLYRTVFKDDVWVQVLFDKSTQEISFMTSNSEDVFSFTTDKRQDVRGNVMSIFSHLLYILPFLVKQFRPLRLMFNSKPHTKKIYDLVYAKQMLQQFGYETVSKVDTGSETQYVYKVA